MLLGVPSTKAVGHPWAAPSAPAKLLEAQSLSAPGKKWGFSEMEVIVGVSAPPL